MKRAHAGEVGGHSVWFRWTAPASGPVDFNTVGSDFNTTLAVYNRQQCDQSHAHRIEQRRRGRCLHQPV